VFIVFENRNQFFYVFKRTSLKNIYTQEADNNHSILQDLLFV